MAVLETDDGAVGVAGFHYPTGWFQVGWSEEIAAGEVRSLKYFGQDLALWRGGRILAAGAAGLHETSHGTQVFAAALRCRCDEAPNPSGAQRRQFVTLGAIHEQ